MLGSTQEAKIIVSIGSEHVRLLKGINFGLFNFVDNNDIIACI